MTFLPPVSGGSSPAEPIRQINLGCGAFRKEGYINLDCRPETNPDVLWDLNRYPYPFPEDRFRLAEADHVLEHLEDPFRAMAEVHRILADGGELRLRVPHFSRGLTNADHRRGFDLTFSCYFDPAFTPGYCGVRFDLKEVRLAWLAQPDLKKAFLSRTAFLCATLAGKILDSLASLSPILCSRLWCFWVGGFEEISFRFICRKAE